jgi:hypothetical protein
MKKSIRLAVACATMLFPLASVAGGRYDGTYTTHLACVAHGETPAYKWEFPSEVKDNPFHGQHGEEGGSGYLVIDGRINDDGSAKLEAKGTLTHNNAHGIFAMKGNNYSYNIKAQFDDTKGTGQRDAGAGVLGRDCSFEFDKQPAGGPPTASASPDAKPDAPPAPSGDQKH